MTWPRPEPARVWEAIEIYLRSVYPGGAPAGVNKRLEKLREAGDLYGSDLMEREAGNAPPRFALRLGNPVYPHMKLVIERTPDGVGHLFKADTHDRHCKPRQDSKEYPAFCELMEKNQQLAAEVESQWAARGIPTFRTYLKADLARRRNA